MIALAVRLGRGYPEGIFMLWHMVIIVAMGVPLRLMNRKCLFMVTGLGSVLGGKSRTFKWQRAIALPIYRFLFSGKNSRVLTHNTDDKQFLVERTGADPSKIVVTPGCGVDPAVFPFFEEMPANDPPVILVPARLIHQKGIVDACAASRMLDDRGIRHKMWLTGGLEPFYPQLSISAAELEELKRSTMSALFIGYAKSLVPIYRQCDIVCYPTRYPEGLPTVLVEAAACGRPVVTTDNVGCRDITADGQTGLVAPVNDPVALADALERLIRDVPLRDRLRRNAYARFRDEFTKDIVLQRTLAAFESLGDSFSEDRTAPDIRVRAAAHS
jgi:glycosyltransferase involved in cell wall biosynthesis